MIIMTMIDDDDDDDGGNDDSTYMITTRIDTDNKMRYLESFIWSLLKKHI